VVVLRDVDRSGEDDDEAGADLADRDKRFAGAKAADLGEPAHPLDLPRLQRGEHLVASRLDDRRHGCALCRGGGKAASGIRHIAGRAQSRRSNGRTAMLFTDAGSPVSSSLAKPSLGHFARSASRELALMFRGEASRLSKKMAGLTIANSPSHGITGTSRGRGVGVPARTTAGPSKEDRT